jgi:hypothetical protein
VPHVRVTFAFGIIAPMSASDPWQHVGEPTPTFDPAALAGFGWELQLPPEQAALLRSLELAEKAEQREREERLAERMEASHNRAVAESITRAHAAGQPWDPSDPWRFYPTHEQRVEEAFAVMDAAASAELRDAKRAAARVLAEHGVHAQVVIDANEPKSPHPGALTVSPGAASEPPVSRAQGMAPGVPEVAAPTPSRRHGTFVKDPAREANYSRMRVRRWRDRTNQARPR